MKLPPRRSPKFRLLALTGILSIAIVALVARRAVKPESSTQTIAPGLTLTTMVKNNFSGPVRLYIIRAEPKTGWRFSVRPGGSTAVEKAFVSEIAAASGATVAVNGSFFFYDGPAVGPLKLDDEWICLPWSNRTSLGIAKDGRLKIDPLITSSVIRLNGTGLKLSSLNGNPQNKPVRNALTALTPRYGPAYALTPDEFGIEVTAGLVSRVVEKGTANIPADGFAVIANGTAMQQFSAAQVGQKAVLEITPETADWNNYPTILGGGPRLVRNGKVETTEVAEKFKPDVVGRGPRTALGVDKDGNYILLVADGWQPQFQGLNLPDTAQELVNLGAVDAINFDGGNSTALAVNGELINHPVAETEVPVANALLLKQTAQP